MRKPIIVGAVVAAAAVGGTAVAAPGGPAAVFGDDPEHGFAEDLAAELDGVSTGEVERALEAVGADHRAERRSAMADAISANLDGVSSEQVADAIAVAEDEMRKSTENGELPEPGQFAETLAEELGVSEDEVEAALQASGEQAFEEHRDELEKRLDEAVESGQLSEERADAMRKGIERGGPPVLAPAPGGPDGHGLGPLIHPPETPDA